MLHTNNMSYSDSILNERLKALSCITRREIINEIKDNPMTIRNIAAKCNTAYNVIKKHIMLMVDCGLITQSKHGNVRYYQLNKKTAKEIIDSIKSLIS